MTVKADAVKAVSQQFKDRTHSVIDGVMAHLRDDNAKELLGPGLSPLIGRGSLKSIVTFALYADVLRMVRDIIMADGGISDEEVRESLGLLSVLAAGFANVRKEYAPYNALSADNVREFLAHYNTDKGLFGHGNEATRWSGVRICQAVHAFCGDFRPLAKFNAALLEWATAIADSDTAIEAEQVVLYSLTAFLSETTQTTAVAAGAIPSTQSVQSVSAAPDGCDSEGQEKAIDKACPYCGETILAVAIKCKHCGEMLGPASKQTHASAIANNLMPADGTQSGLSAEVNYPEIKRTCNKCGNVWFSDSKEEEWLDSKVKLEAISGLFTMAGTALSGYSAAGQWGSVDQQQRSSQQLENDSDKLKRFRRCSRCNSTSFTEIKPPDPDAKPPAPRDPAATRKIWGGVLIVMGTLLGMNSLAAFGTRSAQGVIGGFVLLGISCAVVYGGLVLRGSHKAIAKSAGRVVGKVLAVLKVR